jgi:hypothetical protein
MKQETITLFHATLRRSRIGSLFKSGLRIAEEPLPVGLLEKETPKKHGHCGESMQARIIFPSKRTRKNEKTPFSNSLAADPPILDRLSACGMHRCMAAILSTNPRNVASCYCSRFHELQCYCCRHLTVDCCSSQPLLELF